MPKKPRGPEQGSGKERDQRPARLVKNPRGHDLMQELRRRGLLVEPPQPQRPEKDLEINIPVGKAPFDYVSLDKGGPRHITLQEEFARKNVPYAEYKDAASTTYQLLEEVREKKREDMKEYEVTVHRYRGSQFHVVRMNPEYSEFSSTPARVALVHVNEAGRGYALYTTTAAFTDDTLSRVKNPAALHEAMRSPHGPSRRGRGGLYIVK